MFKITEVKSWAKRWGYSITKTKDDSENGATYYWSKDDDNSISGSAASVSKVAKAVYNHMTNNQYVEHQEQYKINLQNSNINQGGFHG